MPNASAGTSVTDTAQILNGIIIDADINASAAIADTKLAQIATAGKVSGAAFTSLASIPVGAGVIPQVNLPSAGLQLLKSGSGTSTNTSANILDSIAISGLTALDTLLVYHTISAITAGGGYVELYNSTDSIQIAQLNEINGTPTNTSNAGQTILQQEQQNAKHVLALMTNMGSNVISTAGSDANASGGNGMSRLVTTNWTGSWTLALRSRGVVASGTLRWSWKVFKLIGQ